jgi:hypothetical protein
MKKAFALSVLCLFALPLAFAQQQADAATKQDVEELLLVTGARQNIQVVWDSMAKQAASSAAEAYQRKHPNASPLQVRKAAELAGTTIQKAMQVLSIDELLEAMVPVYQRHLTHSDVRIIIDFYNSPTGQKMIKETPTMMAEGMQAIQPILQKHSAELEAQAEAAAEASKQADTQSK